MSGFIEYNVERAAPPCQCKGVFFRCENTFFYHPEKFTIEKRLRFRALMRMSCKGERTHEGFCAWQFAEEFCDSLSLDYVIIPPNPTNRGIYQLHVVNVSTDGETGHWDHWDIELREVKP